MNEIKSYIYLDEEAVNSIYAQLKKKTIAKKTMGQAASAAAMVYLGEGKAKTIHDICTKSVCRLLAREGTIVPDQRK